MAEERRRIDEVNRTILESFAVFQERGMLHDYEGREDVADTDKKGKAPEIDLDKLPPSIREMLKVQGGDKGDLLKVSPEMIEKLKKEVVRKMKEAQSSSTEK